MSLVSKSDNGVLTKRSPDDIRRSRGVNVRFYREFLAHLAELRAENPDYAIMLRGQKRDFRDPDNGTVLSPTAFRSDVDATAAIDSKLEHAAQLLGDECSNKLHPKAIAALKMPLIAQAILQHYEVVPTPWLDVTSSAEVSVWFACDRHSSIDDPLIYALAVPRERLFFAPQGLENGLVCYCLSSICPSSALRPHFQEAFTLAELSNTRGQSNRSCANFSKDLSQHLLCKFKPALSTFLAEQSMFFGCRKSSGVLPGDNIDPMRDICGVVKRRLG